MAKRVLALGLVVLVAAGVGRAELPKHKARPGKVCGIPDYAYRTVLSDNPPATVTAVSLVRVPATVLPGTVAPVIVDGVVVPQPARLPQVYQLLETRLQIDHCFLSRVAVALHPDGSYQITFRADQNPLPVADLLNGSRGEQRPLPLNDIRSPLRSGERVETKLQTTQFRRNLFIVKVRAYAAYPYKPDEVNRVPGTPALVEFPVEPFWVQRAEPYSGSITGRSELVRAYYDYLERVEVEFTYR